MTYLIELEICDEKGNVIDFMTKKYSYGMTFVLPQGIKTVYIKIFEALEG